jgi:hypothetical protein
MIQLSFGNSAEVLRLAYPLSWDAGDLTGFDLTVNDRQNTELIAATAGVPYPSTTLDGAATRYSTTFTIDSGATELKKGDLVQLIGINGTETHTVKGYDSTNFVVTIEDILDNAYDDGDTVYGLFGSVTIDVSDGDDFPVGQQLTLLWEPAGTGDPFTDLAEIADLVQVDLAAFEEDFEALFPRAYIALTQPNDRLSRVLRDAQRYLRRRMMKDHKMDIGRVMDQNLLAPALRLRCAIIWTMNGDDELKEERKELNSQFDDEISILSGAPVWVDNDLDKKEDTDETIDHPHIFERTW